MRSFAKLSFVVVVVLAVAFLAVRWAMLKKSAKVSVASAQQQAVKAPPAAADQFDTNNPNGFYLGDGDSRVFVNFATPDPVLRTFFRSVMEGNSDPIAKGKQIFQKICAICHQLDGGGKEGLAPPLEGSEWVLAPRGDRLARIVLNGLSGPVRVEGRDWKLSMPPLRENLNDDQIAVVLSYVRAHLGTNHAGRVPVEMVTAARKEPRKSPESVEALLRVPER